MLSDERLLFLWQECQGNPTAYGRAIEATILAEQGMAMVPRKMTVAVGCAWKDATDAGATLQEMWDAMIAAAEKEHG